MSTLFRATLLLTGLTCVVGSAPAQQEYPSRAVRVVVPYPTGGSVDFLARLFSPGLNEALGRQFIVDNRGGGNSIIGTDLVAKSPPDGYTLLLAASGMLTIHHMYRKLPFNVINDFAPIAGIARSDFLLLVHPSLPVTTLREFVALAKRRPGELNYATSSTGGPTHLSAVQLEMVAKVKMQQVPYKGGGPAMTDLLGGQIQLVFANPASSMAFIKAGRVKAIAVAGEKRLEMLPEVPTFAEAGVSGVTTINWYAVFAPSNTPRPIIEKLSGALQKITATPDTKSALANQGVESFYAGPEQFDRMRREDLATLGKLIKAADIQSLD